MSIVPDIIAPTLPAAPAPKRDDALLGVLEALAGAGSIRPTTFGTGLMAGLGAGAAGFVQSAERQRLLKAQEQERQDRQALLEEERTQRRQQLRRTFLAQADEALSAANSAEEFEELRTRWKTRALEYGVDPADLDALAFPQTRRKAIQEDRAKGIIDTLLKVHGADKVFSPSMLSATVDVDGTPTSVRDLLKIAGFPIPQREGQDILPTAPKRLTMAEVFPEVFAKDASLAHIGRLPAPLDKAGNVDTAEAMVILGRAGVKNPTEIAAAKQKQLTNERADIRARMAAIQSQMNSAKTEAQFKATVQAWNNLVNNVRQYKPYLGFTELPLDVPTATAQWAQAGSVLFTDPVTGEVVRTTQVPRGGRVVPLQQPRRGRGGAGGATGVSPSPAQPTPVGVGRYRVVPGPRGGQYILDTKTGIRLTTSQVIHRANSGDEDARKVLGEVGGGRVGGGVPDAVQKEYDRLQGLLLSQPERRADIEVRIQEMEYRYPALGFRGTGFRGRRPGGQAQPVPPKGQAPTPAVAPTPRASQMYRDFLASGKQRIPRVAASALGLTPSEIQWLIAQGVIEP